MTDPKPCPGCRRPATVDHRAYIPHYTCPDNQCVYVDLVCELEDWNALPRGHVPDDVVSELTESVRLCLSAYTSVITPFDIPTTLISRLSQATKEAENHLPKDPP